MQLQAPVQPVHPTRRPMLKSDLIERIALNNPHLYRRDVEILVS